MEPGDEKAKDGETRGGGAGAEHAASGRPHARFVGLQRRVLAPIALVFLLLCVGLVAAGERLHRSQMLEDLGAESRLVASSLEALASSHAPPAALAEAMSAFGRHARLESAFVVRGAPPVVVASTDDALEGLGLDELPQDARIAALRRVLATSAAEEHYDGDQSVFMRISSLPDGGAALVALDAGEVRRMVLGDALRLSVIVFGSLMMFAAATVFVVRGRVVRRLAALAREIGSDGAAHEWSEQAVDEIALLENEIVDNRRRSIESVRELERLALVARNTTNAVIITDLERRIVWTNEGFTRITGWSQAEVLGRHPGSFLQFERTDQQAVARLRDSLSRHEPCRVQLLNRGRGGREYWLDIEVQPVRDASGAVTGFMAVETDVTDIVQTREELRASERRQKLIVAGAELGTWDWHVPAGDVHFNERWCEMLGYAPEEIAPHVSSWERMVHPDDMPGVRAALRAHFEGRADIYRCEHRLRSKSGALLWVLDAGKVYERDAEGRPLRMAGIHLDVTERRLAQERFELVVAGSAAGIWDWYDGAQGLWLSARLLELLGERDDADIGAHLRWMERVHPDDRKLLLRALAAHRVRREPFSLDCRLARGDGGWRWFHAQGQCARDPQGRPSRMAGSLEDVHERRLLEQARARLAAIVEGSQDAIFGLDLAGVSITCNAAAGRMFGVEQRELLGRSELDLVAAQERERELAAFERVVAGATPQQYESLRVRADGSMLEVSVSLSPVLDASGALVGTAKIVRDVSERREKRELQQLNALLARQNRRLEEMTERAHRFVDDVSHEFRTPLAVIKEYSAMIADGLAGPVTGSQAEWLQVVDAATVDLNQMVEDFLDSSKLRAGRLRVDRRPCDFASIVGGVHRMIARKAASRFVRIVEDLQPGLPEVFVDQEKARRVLMNLLTNAVKFSPEGGEVVLSARLLPSGDVRCAVRDRGPGLGPDDMALLFQRFRQLPNAMAPSVKGFGLGLNIARQLVWLNLGVIAVESVLGEGATFSFTMPSNRMDLVVRRFFERLPERDDLPPMVALLRVHPRAGGDMEELRRLCVAATRPSDLVVEARGGDALLLFGPCGAPATWRSRIAQAVQAGDGEGGVAPRVEIAGRWGCPAEEAAAQAAIIGAAAREAAHAA